MIRASFEYTPRYVIESQNRMLRRPGVQWRRRAILAIGWLYIGVFIPWSFNRGDVERHEVIEPVRSHGIAFSSDGVSAEHAGLVMPAEAGIQ